MKRWQVLHMHKFFLSLLIVYQTFASLHFVSYWAGIYGKMSKGNCVPLDLQPDPSTIVVAYRKYFISARNSSYKKR
jgi:hypothetical protein